MNIRLMLRELPKGMRRVGIVALVLFLSGSALAFQSERIRTAPAFDRGGSFGDDDAGFGGPVGEFASATPSPDEVAATPTDAGPGPGDRTTSRSQAVVRGGRATPAPTPAPAQSPSQPALGRYTFAVDGSETATGFGTRRFEETMTLDAKRSPDLEPDEVVFDINFYPSRGAESEHQEREIVAFRPDGIFFTYEAGKVIFGPGAQEDQGNYEPPMLQVPVPQPEPQTMPPPTSCPSPVASGPPTGTSQVKRPESNEVSRVEDWWVRVIGRETISAAGATFDTVVVRIERKTQPGSADQLQRCRTYWYAPAKKMWVKFHEKMHGERSFGVSTFTYDSDFVATLRSGP